MLFLIDEADAEKLAAKNFPVWTPPEDEPETEASRCPNRCLSHRAFPIGYRLEIRARLYTTTYRSMPSRESDFDLSLAS